MRDLLTPIGALVVAVVALLAIYLAAGEVAENRTDILVLEGKVERLTKKLDAIEGNAPRFTEAEIAHSLEARGIPQPQATWMAEGVSADWGRP